MADIDPDGSDAEQALERLYEALSKWTDLIELLVRRLERSEGPAALALRFRMGTLLETKLDDLPGAIDAYEECVKKDPRYGEALAALERLVLQKEHRFRIAQFLEGIYRDLDEWRKLVVIYRAELEFIDEPKRRAELLGEIARIHVQRGGDLRLAWSALATAFSEDPSNETLLAELERLSAKTENWGELVALLEKTADEAGDSELQHSLLSRAAHVHLERLHEVEAAIAAWRRVLEVREEDSVALQALEQLYGQQGRYEELSEVLEKRSQLAEDAIERKSLLYRIADIEERNLTRVPRAVEMWRRVLDIDEEDGAALDSLERLYEGAEDWRSLAEVLTRKVELASGEVAARLHLRLAQVYEERLRDPFEAIRAYQAVREVDRQNGHALSALERLYAGERQWMELLDVLEAQMELASGGPPDAREAIRIKKAHVLAEEVGDTAAAIAAYEEVLQALPQHSQAEEALWRLVRSESTREPAAAVLAPLLRTRGQWQRLLELQTLLIDAESDPERRRDLLAEQARVQERGLGSSQAAFQTWGRVLGENPGDDEAMGELERLASERGSFADLAELLEERLKSTLDAEGGRVLALKLARLYEEVLGDAGRAAAKLKMALEYPGDDAPVLSALDRLLEALGSWQELAGVLEQEMAASTDPMAQAAFGHRLGLVRAEYLSDPEGALRVWREVLDREPTHDGAIGCVARYLDDVTYRAEAVAMLEPCFESRGDARSLFRVLAAKLTLLGEALERARLFERMAELAEQQLSDLEGALRCYGQALEEDPREERLVGEVVRLGGKLGRPPAAAELLERAADRAVSLPEVARELGLRAGLLWLDEAKDLDRAQARLLKVLALDGEAMECVRALERIYRAKSDAKALCELLHRRSKLELDPREQRSCLSEAAKLSEIQLGDLDGALAAWRSVLELDDQDREALAELVRLYERKGDAKELVRMLDLAAQAAQDPADAAQLHCRAGRLYHESLKQADRAVEAYRAALDVATGYADALSALERLYAEKSDWPAVQEVLTQQLQFASSDAVRIATHRKLAELAEDKLGESEDALAHWREIETFDPESEEVQLEIEKRLAKLERWQDLAESMERRASARGKRSDRAGEITLLMELADLWDRRIGNVEEATVILERIAEREPKEVGVIVRLAKIYEASGEWDKCAEALERATQLGAKGSDAAELYFRRGKIELERSGNAEQAEASFRQALHHDPRHGEALLALEQVARNRADWKQVAELLEARAPTIETPEKRVEVLTELALLLREKLSDSARALAHLEKAAELAPKQVKVTEPLADAYYAEGRWKEAAALYTGLLEGMKNKRNKEAARYQFRLGAIHEQLGESAKASEFFNQSLLADPAHGPTLAALGRIYTQQSDWERARKIFRSMLLQNLDAETKMTKADVYFELGKIHTHLGEAPKARNMYERGLEIDPQHSGLKSALAELR